MKFKKLKTDNQETIIKMEKYLSIKGFYPNEINFIDSEEKAEEVIKNYFSNSYLDFIIKFIDKRINFFLDKSKFDTLIKNNNYHNHLAISFSPELMERIYINIPEKNWNEFIIRIGIIMASQQFKFWNLPRIKNSNWNSKKLIELFEKVVIESIQSKSKWIFNLDKSIEKIIISFKKELINNLLTTDLDKRLDILDSLMKYGINLNNPIFRKDPFFKKGNFAKIFIINTFEKYSKNFYNEHFKYFAAIDYRLPQALKKLELFPINKDSKLFEVYGKILKQEPILENSFDEIYLRMMSTLVILRINKILNIRIGIGNGYKNYYRQIDSYLFLSSRNTEVKAPHHYCYTDNY